MRNSATHSGNLANEIALLKKQLDDLSSSASDTGGSVIGTVNRATDALIEQTEAADNFGSGGRHRFPGRPALSSPLAIVGAAGLHPSTIKVGRASSSSSGSFHDGPGVQNQLLGSAARCSLWARKALVHRGRLNREGVNGLAAQAGAFQVNFRVEEGDPLQFGQGDPVFLARCADHAENIPK